MVNGRWEGYVVEEQIGALLFDGKVLDNRYNGIATQIIFGAESRTEKSGYFSDNKLNGQGKEQRIKNSIEIPYSYEGGFSEDRFDGEGVEWMEGWEYHGQWENGSWAGSTTTCR